MRSIAAAALLLFSMPAMAGKVIWTAEAARSFPETISCNFVE
jgi:hypothetical protein